MLKPLAPKYNSTYTVYKGSPYKLPSKGILDRIPGCGRWQTSHCRATVQVTVCGGPLGFATAHSRGFSLLTEGRNTRAKEKKCDGYGLAMSSPCKRSLGVRALGVDCRWLPVPGGFEVVVGCGGGNPPGSDHG